MPMFLKTAATQTTPITRGAPTTTTTPRLPGAAPATPTITMPTIRGRGAHPITTTTPTPTQTATTRAIKIIRGRGAHPTTTRRATTTTIHGAPATMQPTPTTMPTRTTRRGTGIRTTVIRNGHLVAATITTRTTRITEQVAVTPHGRLAVTAAIPTITTRRRMRTPVVRGRGATATIITAGIPMPILTTVSLQQPLPMQLVPLHPLHSLQTIQITTQTHQVGIGAATPTIMPATPTPATRTAQQAGSRGDRATIPTAAPPTIPAATTIRGRGAIPTIPTMPATPTRTTITIKITRGRGANPVIPATTITTTTTARRVTITTVVRLDGTSHLVVIITIQTVPTTTMRPRDGAPATTPTPAITTRAIKTIRGRGVHPIIPTRTTTRTITTMRRHGVWEEDGAQIVTTMPTRITTTIPAAITILVATRGRLILAVPTTTTMEATTTTVTHGMPAITTITSCKTMAMPTMLPMDRCLPNTIRIRIKSI